MSELKNSRFVKNQGILFRIQSLKAERRIDKKKKKEKKNRKKGNTLAINNPEAVKMELFSNTLKRPQSSNKNEENENLPPKKPKKSNVPDSVIRENDNDNDGEKKEEDQEAKKILDSDSDDGELEIKKRKILSDDEDESKTIEDKKSEAESNPNPGSPDQESRDTRKAKNDLDSGKIHFTFILCVRDP